MIKLIKTYQNNTSNIIQEILFKINPKNQFKTELRQNSSIVDNRDRDLCRFPRSLIIYLNSLLSGRK